MGVFKSIITFGASNRIEKRVNEFNVIYNEYEALYNKMEEIRNEINSVLEKLIKAKVDSVKSLNKINKISKNLLEEDKIILNKKIESNVKHYTFSNIKHTLSTANAVINTTGGVTAGVGTAVGAWALVSSVGISSTGTAIGGLSGVAASNATLAWFGGGALAAGGGGTAAGATVLGGLFVIPIIVVSGILSHRSANKKIKELDEKTIEINKAIRKIKENLPTLESIYISSITPAKKLTLSLEKARELFEEEYNRIYKEIYKIPVITRVYKWFRKLFVNDGYFNDRDLELIAYIGMLANDLAELINTKIFDEE
ncbi:hypothetical protein [Bacillus sp. ISL-45]|uniref:hypothetical protein n=1 Tax=Bacillus sp. ISL-45 TaxID=2819128 RepID=UPI001BE941C5|nr:hypothetical protein [Bacillus sp. ISL-45]MBT2661638.1 hypothetical protein [Bacillus sp. ISL-45]